MNTLQLQFLMLTFAGWVNRTQQNVIEYSQEENRVLRKQLGGKRLRFTDRQRRRLAAKAKAIGRTEAFRELLEPSGVKTVKLPAHSPDLNAYAERFVRSIESECLAQIIPFGKRHLRHAVMEYTEHDHLERNHQGLDDRLIEGRSDGPNMDGAVDCRERLGSILDFYHRRAARPWAEFSPRTGTVSHYQRATAHDHEKPDPNVVMATS